MSPPRPEEPPPSTADPPSVVEWRYDPTTVRWLRWITVVRTALVSTATALVVAALAVLVVLAGLLSDGVPGADAAAVVLVGLAFGLVRMALSPMGALLVSRVERERIASAGALAVPDGFGARPFSRRRLAVAVPGALVVVAAAWLWLPSLAVLATVGVAAALVVGLASTAGRLDLEERTYVTHVGDERSFAALAGHTRRRIGPLVLFRLRYPRRPGRLAKLQRVLVPVDRAPDAAALFDAVASPPADAPEANGRSSNRTVTLVAGAMGVAHLAGAALAVAGLGGLLGWYLGAIAALFGFLLLAVAVYEG